MADDRAETGHLQKQESGAGILEDAHVAQASGNTAEPQTLDLFSFVPFRLNRLAAEVSSALAVEYRDRYALDVPSWRILATLGYRGDACTAQFIAACTRTHKSTISRAVTGLLGRGLLERIGNADDRREFTLRLTTEGTRLYRELIPHLLARETAILSCLSTEEQAELSRLLGKLEHRLDLVQARKPASGA